MLEKKKYKSGYDKIRVIISGPGNFDDYEVLCKVCDYILINRSNIEIVSGGSIGADRLGERYAKDKGYWYQIFRPEWDKYDKGAVLRRNGEMAKYADALIAFWDGKCYRTAHLINMARLYKLKIKVYRYDNR